MKKTSGLVRIFKWKNGYETRADSLSEDLKHPNARKWLIDKHGEAEVRRAEKWIRLGIWDKNAERRARRAAKKLR